MSGYVMPVYQNAINNSIQEYDARQKAEAASGGSGSKDSNLEKVFQAKTSPYKASNNPYANMPQGINFPAFMPGQQQAIANQLSSAYGAPAADYNAQMSSIYAPMNTTRLFEPITTTARAFGLKPGENPGQWSAGDNFNKKNYQQWGQQTNSPFLQSIFGLKSRTPSAEEQTWMATEQAKKDALSKKQLRKYEPPKNPYDTGGW